MIATRLLTDRLPKRRQPKRPAGHVLGAPQRSPREQIDAGLERQSGPQGVYPVPAGFTPGAEPPEDDPRGEDKEAAAPPQPSFTPAPPAPTGQQPVLRTPTGPMHAVPADGDPYSPENRERAAAARAAVAADPLGLSPELLGRVLEGLKNLPVDRAAKFSLDKAAAEEGGLPFFRSLVRQYGWCGLHAERKPPARQRPRYTLEHWHADAMRLVAEATDRARCEVFGHISAFTEQEQRIRTAENAANGLGYPRAAA